MVSRPNGLRGGARPPAGTIPETPRSCQFKDVHGRLIYVGKARNLRADTGVQPDQGAPAPVQRAAAGRQELPVPGRHGLRRLAPPDGHAWLQRKGVQYFGPYANAYVIRETLDLLLRPFPLRTCTDNRF